VTFTRTLSGEVVAFDPSAIDAFAGRLAGRVLVESAAEYEQARRVWNGLIDKRPAVIVRCSGVADVLDSLRFARDHNLLVAVRGGGHNVAGFGTCDGGLVIDLSPLRGIRVDPAKRTVRAQAGVRWGDLDRETQVFGLAVPGGVVSTTGIAGLTLGGGQGWLRRTYGMTCDSLLSADVITSDGEFVTASDVEHADLFWALRGGGGNFGIVTDFEYRLHPVGPVVAYAAAMYPVEATASVLPAFRDYMDTAPDALNASATLWTVPSTPAFPERLHGRSVIAVSGVYVGDGQRGEQILGAIRAFGDPTFDVLEALPYTSMQRMVDVVFPARELRYYWKGLYLDGLGEAVISNLAAAFARRPSPRSMLVIWAQGGAFSRVRPGDTAVGSRNSPFLLEILANWQEPECTEANIAWARAVFDDMHQQSHGKPNFNFPGVDDDMKSFVNAAFAEHYERLVRVKRKYDPANVFRVNQNIT
jgi:FAD/FMN-containing dehydrogenase